MSERFIKFIPGEIATFLLENYPNAFLLLCLIAQRARRINGLPDGLIIGDAMLGKPKQAGLTRQEYRTAIDKLVEFDFIEIVHNGKKLKKREKSTIKATIDGMLVNLKDSRIWDINSEDSNQLINQRATNEQPTSNHKEERIRKNKKEKEEQPQTPSFFKIEKIKFRENVELSQEEFDSLVAKHGQDNTEKMLDILDSYKGSTGKVYKSDFYVMKEGGWVVERLKSQLLKPIVSTAKKGEENESFAKQLEEKYSNINSPMRCRICHDPKKDQRGLLFEWGMSSFFISFSNGDFKNEAIKFLKSKNLEIV